MSKVQEALEKAKAAAAAKAANGDSEVERAPRPRVSKVKAANPDKEAQRVERERQRAEKKAQNDAARAERKAQADAKREAAKAERLRAKAAKAVMPKVNKKLETIRAGLPALNDNVANTFSSITAALSTADLTILSEHLSFYLREAATLRAGSGRFNVGDEVRIDSGAAKHLGKTGVITYASRLRARVDVGAKAPVYLFNSDLTLIKAAEVEDEEVAEVESAEEAVG